MMAAVICYFLQRWLRCRRLAALARRWGLAFNPWRDYGFAARYPFFDQLQRGKDHYAFNVISGRLQQHVIFAFDYHYEVPDLDFKSISRRHHYFSFFILLLPAALPAIQIAPENWRSKVAQAFGYPDIDFESAEFSKAFCVRSKDKRFAYAVCNAQMMEFLLANRRLAIEIDGPALALAFDRRLSPAQFETNLQRLVEIRSRLPDFLFTQHP